MRRGLSARVGGAVLVGLLIASVLPASVLANPPAIPSVWAWVTVRQPTSASYTPAAKDQGSSVGGTNTVQRLGVGRYVAYFPGLNPTTTCPSPNYNGCGGNPMVSALGGALRTCDVVEMGSGDPVSVWVDCYDKNGNPADSMFTALFVAPRDNHGTVAYLFSDQANSAAFRPNQDYNYNSSYDQGTDMFYNYVWHPSAGLYQVALAKMLDGTRGNLQVVATGGACKIESRDNNTDPGDPYSNAWVRCRDVTGNATETEFFLAYTDGVGATGVPGRSSAYVFVNKPTATNYFPVAAFRYSSAGTTPAVTRASKGVYRVKLPGMPLGGAAFATAFGTSNVTCQLTSINKTKSPQVIGVACFNPNGTAADSKFYLSYVR